MRPDCPKPRGLGEGGAGQCDLWLSPAMENAVDAWAAAQPDPKPGRVEAIRRLLDKALGAAP